MCLKPGRGAFRIIRHRKRGPYFFEVNPYTYVSSYKSRRRVQKIYDRANENAALASFGCSKTPLLQSKIQKSAHKKIPSFCVDIVHLESSSVRYYNQERRFSRRQSEERRKKREVCIARARFLCPRFWGAFVYAFLSRDDGATFENSKSDLWKRIRYSRAVLRHWGRAVERCEWKMHRLERCDRIFFLQSDRFGQPTGVTDVWVVLSDGRVCDSVPSRGAKTC